MRANMDIVVPKKTLLELLGKVVPVADRKSAMPALANVCITADGSVLVVGGTDLYLSMSGQTSADVATAGSVAVPAKDLLDRVKAMPDGPVQILVGDNAQTTLKAVGSPRRYTLHGIPGSEFPNLPKPSPDAPVLELPAATLAKLIARTKFSISSDETRPNVNSALFEWTGDRVRMVSTDGHRLSKAEATVEGSSARASMLIPLKAITELLRLVDGVLDNVRITQSGPNAFFFVGGMCFSVKLVDAQFPPYMQVIPSAPSQTARAPRATLADALRAVSLASSDRTGGVKLTFLTNTLRITSESPESGNGFDEVSIDYAGPESTIGVNAKYLLDLLGAIDEEEVAIGFSGELDPVLLHTPADKDFTGVVMPMRV